MDRMNLNVGIAAWDNGSIRKYAIRSVRSGEKMGGEYIVAGAGNGERPRSDGLVKIAVVGVYADIC